MHPIDRIEALEKLVMTFTQTTSMEDAQLLVEKITKERERLEPELVAPRSGKPAKGAK